MAHNEAPAEDLNIKTGGLRVHDLEANGSETVTISNVAPSGVGTATISAWLKIRSAAGTEYFIPCWT